MDLWWTAPARAPFVRVLRLMETRSPRSTNLSAAPDKRSREKLLSDPVDRPQFDSGYFADQLLGGWHVQFPVTADMDYEPTWESSVAGAHVTTCHDFSCPTFLLTHWVRDRNRGSGTVPIETAVKWQTMDAPAAYGLHDRGRLASGFLADINVIDLQKLALGMPYLANDLPGGCLRVLQQAVGYTATLKSGVVTYRNGEATGARPGGVIRGPQRKRASKAA
jgi:hypothetical protein